MANTTSSSSKVKPRRRGAFALGGHDTEYLLNGGQAGNRVQSRDAIPNIVQTGTYATGNRLTAWGGATYTRDLDGNDSTKTVGTEVTTYSWTADGKLASATVGTVKLAYTYDAFGQLIQRSRSTNGGSPALERQFLWDQGELLAELDSSATHRIAEYQYWPGTDQPYALFTGADSITATRFFAQDAMNNVIGVFNSTSVLQTLTYEGFGAIDSLHTSLGTLADTNRLRWKGLVYEGDSTRLYYVRNRWYDAQAGRFLSEDPSGFAGGPNLYVYAGDDAIGGLDPQGLSDDEGDNSCAFVNVTIEDSNTGTITRTSARLCSGDGSAIGQVLDFLATQGVGDGSAVWGGGVFATPAATGAIDVQTQWPDLVAVGGRLYSLEGCPAGRSGMLGTGDWPVGYISYDGVARLVARLPMNVVDLEQDEGIYFLRLNVTTAALPTQVYVGVAMVSCSDGTAVGELGMSPRR